MKLEFHSHVFTSNNLGDNIISKIGAYIERKIENSVLVRILLRMLNPFSSKDKFDNLANFLRQLSKSPERKVNEFFSFIAKKYPNEDWGINILTVDFDHMKRGTPKEKFRRQLADAVAVKYSSEFKKKHVKVFMGIDPRNPDLEQLLNIYIDKIDGFKLYCYNGFFPYDERLNIVYQYAERYNKPVLYHCSDTNINYYGGKDINELLKQSQIPLLPNRKGNKELSTNFCNPMNYLKVIQKYPKIKFVIAHWGGCEMFNDIVTSILLSNDNAFADISFFAHSKENQRYIYDKWREFPQLIDKTIFGSDDFMTESVGGRETVYSFLDWISVEKKEKVTTNWEKLYS